MAASSFEAGRRSAKRQQQQRFASAASLCTGWSVVPTEGAAVADRVPSIAAGSRTLANARGKKKRLPADAEGSCAFDTLRFGHICVRATEPPAAAADWCGVVFHRRPANEGCYGGLFCQRAPPSRYNSSLRIFSLFFPPRTVLALDPSLTSGSRDRAQRLRSLDDPPLVLPRRSALLKSNPNDHILSSSQAPVGLQSAFCTVVCSSLLGSSALEKLRFAPAMCEGTSDWSDSSPVILWRSFPW